ncbi:DNA-binding protein [Sphingobacteriaceae bacterium]|nr:DNA-binding protein [Sphingobacteriaceae bacterium]
MRLIFHIFYIVLIFSSPNFSAQTPSAPKYIRVTGGYLMVLKQGDSLFKELKTLATQENIPSASFTGLGFANIEFGFFNAKKKAYKKQMFKNMELASLDGSIAWQNGQPSIHAHGVGGDKNFRARAGHLMSAEVSTGSLEIMICVYQKRLERRKDEVLGADVLDLE